MKHRVVESGSKGLEVVEWPGLGRGKGKGVLCSDFEVTRNIVLT